jgi:hypothetical protein
MQPRESLVAPLPVLAILVVALNDHLFKRWWPGAVTGKLSDLAGLFLVPILLLTALELGGQAVGWRPSVRVCAGVLLAIAVAYTVVKATSAGATVYGELLGRVRASGPVDVVVDGTDLLVLPVLLGSWWCLRRPGPIEGSV